MLQLRAIPTRVWLILRSHPHHRPPTTASTMAGHRQRWVFNVDSFRRPILEMFSASGENRYSLSNEHDYLRCRGNSARCWSRCWIHADEKEESQKKRTERRWNGCIARSSKFRQFLGKCPGRIDSFDFRLESNLAYVEKCHICRCFENLFCVRSRSINNNNDSKRQTKKYKERVSDRWKLVDFF